jgi:HSP20 family protein
MTHDRIHWMQTLFLPANRSPRVESWAPLVDVYRTRDGWLIKCDLAGVAAEDLTLTIAGPCLTVRGSRRDWCLEEGCSHYLLEISYSQFERTIELPENVEPAMVTTEFREGMLLVRIQREASR